MYTAQDIIDGNTETEITWTHTRTYKEISTHGLYMVDLYSDLGYHPTYRAADVLLWLGY